MKIPINSIEKLITIMDIILTMIIVRPNEIRSLRGKEWTFIYGRRKTGKTFLVENFVDYDEFFFVKRDRTILLKNRWRDFDYTTFIEILRRDLEAGKTIVVDEFHRLGEDFLDIIHSFPKNGRLIVISSTMHTAKTLISKNSPLLGKFSEVNIGLINLGDTLNSLKESIDNPKEMLEIGTIIGEPVTIDFVETGSIYEVIRSFALTVPALIGEIFSEEDRKMTKTYEAIIRAVAVGKITSGEISSFLFSRRLMAKDDPSIIQQYLNNLVNFGILKKVPVWKKRRVVYFHTSPLTKIYYYLDEKYSIGDRKVSKKEMETLMKEITPRVIENSIRELMSELFGMNLFLHEASDFEVDGILVKFSKPEIAFEIKWKSNVDKNDIKKAENNLGRIGVKRKILIVPDMSKIKSDSIEIIDVHDMIKRYNEILRKQG